jgi:Cof subfamily protein (haloacid dehalogenase superfamily)
LSDLPSISRFQIAFCDLDGTLLGPDKRISPANAAAVRDLQAAGLLVVLASGRRQQNSIRYYRELALETPLISCAGALVTDSQTGETLREAPLPPTLAAELVAAGQAEGFAVIYYHRDHLFIARREHWIEVYESRVEEQAEICDLAALAGEAALKIVWYGEPAAVTARRAALEDEYAGRVHIVSTDPENLEFAAQGANKAQACAAVARLLGVERAATLAFGDGENDVPMLDWVGLGIAMDRGAARAHRPAALVSPAGPGAESFARAVGQLREAPRVSR